MNNELCRREIEAVVMHNWSPGANQWLAMSMPHAALAAAAHAMLGHELEAPPTTFVTQCAEAAMTQLRTVHNAACDLAGTNPSALSHPATAKALEQQLVSLLVNCLPERVPTAAKANRGSRAKVVSRFRDFLASKQYQPVYVAEICAAIGVSESSLRHCCQEQLGMGPIHYLWLRRMHLARRALLAGAGAKAVTEVATENGFWELGRFSVQYRALFGESPSATFKRSRRETPGSRER